MNQIYKGITQPEHQGDYGKAIFSDSEAGAEPMQGIVAKPLPGISAYGPDNPNGIGGPANVTQHRGFTDPSQRMAPSGLVGQFRAKNARMKRAQGLSAALNIQSPYAERLAIRNAGIGMDDGIGQPAGPKGRHYVGKGGAGITSIPGGIPPSARIAEIMQQRFGQQRGAFAQGLQGIDAEFAQIERQGISSAADVHQAGLEHERGLAGIDAGIQEANIQAQGGIEEAGIRAQSQQGKPHNRFKLQFQPEFQRGLQTGTNPMLLDQQTGTLYDEQGNPMGIQPQGIGEQQDSRLAGVSDTQSNTAPPEALAFLKQNPQFAEQFRQKYGFLPEGY